MVAWRWLVSLVSAAPPLVPLLSLAAAGCAGEESKTSAELYCDAMCDRLSQCGATGPACKGECVASASSLDLIRTDMMAGLADCIGSATCSAILSDETWGICWRSTAPSVPPTFYGREFCVEYASSLYECGYYYGADECEEDFGPLTDEALERVLSCTEVGCDALDACVGGVLAG